MGNHLFEEVVQLTGLPEIPLRQELAKFFSREGLNPDEATLEDLRRVLLAYLQATMLELKDDTPQY